MKSITSTKEKICIYFFLRTLLKEKLRGESDLNASEIFTSLSYWMRLELEGALLEYITSHAISDEVKEVVRDFLGECREKGYMQISFSNKHIDKS